MGYFLLKRLFITLLVLFGVSTLVFLLIHLIPGDPVDVMLGESAYPGDRELLRQKLGLDKDLITQYFNFLLNLTQFDLGYSIHKQVAVTSLILERLPATAQLAFVSLLVAIMLAIPAGILAALYRNHFVDRLVTGFSMVGVSIPNFWMGPMLILVFSLWAGWFPVSGKDHSLSIILPAITLGTALAAILTRMVRASLLESLQDDYVRTARAKGLPESRVILHHALRNAWLPIITLLGLQFGTLLAGAVITEKVFSWPGVGTLIIDSIHQRDYPVVQGCVLLISATYVLINMLTDFFYGWLDPRVSVQ